MLSCDLSVVIAASAADLLFSRSEFLLRSSSLTCDSELTTCFWSPTADDSLLLASSSCEERKRRRC